ncbi:MAG: hypothetical protein GY788_19130, partial [bacterium]|nr:hypothetical protein [bacterium]
RELGRESGSERHYEPGSYDVDFLYPQATPPTALEITSLRNEPWKSGTDIGDGLPKKGQTDKERVDTILAETKDDLIDTFEAIDATVIPRNGQVWDGPGNGTYTIQDVPDYQIRVTLGPDAPCPQAPQSWNGIPVVFFRE